MLNMLIAMWLVVAAFAFQPGAGLRAIMISVGLLILGFEAAGFFRSRLRFVDTALAIVLILASFVLASGQDAVFWNNFLCGVGLAVFSLVRGRSAAATWMPGTSVRRHADVR